MYLDFQLFNIEIYKFNLNLNMIKLLKNKLTNKVEFL